ncbi:MAG: dephospho-CoA kinase/protein folding accessory protein [Bacillota bacterium]|nr:dephospho-CoA kinase/protein folding accessory protein [Bacillota bacterium]
MPFRLRCTDTGFADKVFHIHVRNPGDWDELHFRDYLISHPEVAVKYAELKRSLFKGFEHDRDGYTASKGEFIRTITMKAREEA